MIRKVSVVVSLAALAALAASMRDQQKVATAPPAAVKPVAGKPGDHASLASYRVFESKTEAGLPAYRGANYEAKVDARGLEFRAGGHRMQMRGATLEQGDASLQLQQGAATRTEWAKAEVRRADTVIEEYVFENGRVEQLFHIAEPLAASGALTLRVAVETSLTGPVTRVSRGDKTWKSMQLQNGGLVFTDASGNPGMTYTDAVAIDAKGRKLHLDPRWENGQVVLELPALYTKDAAYPILIDPWLELDFSASGGGISETGTVSETPAILLFNGSPMVAWSDARDGDFDIYFRYWNGFAWRELGTSGDIGGVSANDGTSTNPTMGLFTPTDTQFTHPFIAWEDDTSGTINVYARFWTGSQWTELAGSASGSGVSLSLGTACRNPQAIGVDGLVDMAPTSVSPDRFETFPCIVWEVEGVGIASRFFYPGDDRLQGPDPNWYENPASFALTGSEYLTLDGSAARPSVAFNAVNNELVVAWEASSGSEYDIIVASAVSGAPYIVAAGGSDTPGPLVPWTFVGGGNVCADVGAVGALSIQPSLTTDGIGTLWVAWQESVGAEREIYAARSAGGGAWASVAGSASGNGVSRTSVVGRVTTSSFPSIALNLGGNRPAVAWEDDAGTNPEIYVRRLNAAGTSWDQVADEGSAMLVAPETTGNDGGISRNSSFSLRPKTAMAPDGSITVAWRDGALGSFDLLVRRYHDNEPRTLAQVDVTIPVPLPLPVGGAASSPTNQVQFTALLFAETASLPTNLRLQLEIRPTTSVFTGQPTHESLEVAPGATATVIFTGLPNVNYHWRARSIDAQGRSSPWISFGGNADGDADFRMDSSTGGPPNNGGSGGASKDKCGLLGAEVLVGLLLAAALRRRKA